MGTYIGIRLAHALVILAIVVVLVFVIARLIPGDAIMAAMAGSVDLHDPAVVARVRQAGESSKRFPRIASHAVGAEIGENHDHRYAHDHLFDRRRSGPRLLS